MDGIVLAVDKRTDTEPILKAAARQAYRKLTTPQMSYLVDVVVIEYTRHKPTIEAGLA